MTPGLGGGDFESADKYAVCLLDFFDNNNTVEKHLFFLIQSILLFHDRCCFTFFFSSSYICTITMTNIQLENIYFSYSKYIIFYQYQNNLPAVHTYIYIMLKFSMPEKLEQENPDHKLEIRPENPDLLCH